MEKHLNPGEQIIHQFGVAPKYITILLILGIVTLPIVIGLYFFYLTLYKKYAIHYAITSKKVLVETGLMNKKIISVTYNTITDMHLSQKLWQRIFGMGTVELNTGGDVGYEVTLKDVADPYAIKREIEKNLR